jgi:proline dehydrogenase
MPQSSLLTSFQNTENAFAYKSDARLKKAYLLFSLMRFNWLVKIGSRLTPWAIRWKLPVKFIIRKTLFEQFVGGENLLQTNEVVAQLSRFGVQVILDYGVEGGAHNDAAMEAACKEFINVIEHASSHDDIPFISIKVTGMVRFSLLEKMDALMSDGQGLLADRYQASIAALSESEKKEWVTLCGRLQRVCKAAAEKNTGVLIDAEETWIQDPIDALTMEMMAQYNREKAVVYNTAQMYRHDRLAFVKACFEAAEEKKFILALKIVRGAYMEKERARADAMGYASPIQPDKQSSDRDFDAAVLYCLDRIEQIAIVVASHNEESNLKTISLMRERGLPNDHSHVHLSQLFGMSDHITFNLAAAGYRVSKYLPFGPIEDVVPYLMRRAQENTSVAGQTSRELALLKQERRRRAK